MLGVRDWYWTDLRQPSHLRMIFHSLGAACALHKASRTLRVLMRSLCSQLQPAKAHGPSSANPREDSAIFANVSQTHWCRPALCLIAIILFHTCPAGSSCPLDPSSAYETEFTDPSQWLLSSQASTGSDQVIIIFLFITHILCCHSPVLIQIHIIIIVLFLLQARFPRCRDCAPLQPCLVILLDCQACTCTAASHCWQQAVV